MELYNYLDNEYVKTNIEIQKGYNPSLKAKTNAIHTILEFQKSLLKTKWFFGLLFSFAKCVALNQWPEVVDLKKYLQEQNAKKAALKSVEHSKDTECQNENQVVS